VKAAARALNVSEPAVSGAVGALRKELGDELYVRAAGAIELTPGGRRLASAAGEILGLVAETRVAVGRAASEKPALRVAATPSVAEFAAGPLLYAFGRRHPDIEVALEVASRRDIAGLLTDRTVDIALGPAISGTEDGPEIGAEPFLRYGLIVVAAPSHTLAGSRALAPAALVSTPWLLGPGESDPATDTGAFLARQSIAPRRTRSYPNFAGALAQAASGRGVSLAIAHTVRDELERSAGGTRCARHADQRSLVRQHVGSGAPHRLRQRDAALRDDAGCDPRDAESRRRSAGRALRADGPLELVVRRGSADEPRRCAPAATAPYAVSFSRRWSS
jgi:DNA-binding transcriptional LysR family regulator